MAWKQREDSLSKCVIYFADGNARTFFSYDWVHRYSMYKDRELGLKRLRNLIDRYGDKAATAVIYDMSTGERIEQYEYGTKTFY